MKYVSLDHPHDFYSLTENVVVLLKKTAKISALQYIKSLISAHACHVKGSQKCFQKSGDYIKYVTIWESATIK